MNLSELKKPFSSDRISWRVGATNGDKTKGLALAYIDSRDVQDRLDEVCGPEGWADNYPLVGPTTLCSIAIKIGDEWISKTDGAGSTDVEAEKGQLSDAFKRAAVKWGIGRYLYEDRYKNLWVEIEPAGRSFKIKAHELARLAKAFGAKQETGGLPHAMKVFIDRLGMCTAEEQITKLIAKNQSLMLALHENEPVLYEKLAVEINQHKEAFRLADAAE